MVFYLLYSFWSFLFTLAYASRIANNSNLEAIDRGPPGLGDAIVNVQPFTQFVYEGYQVYVYSVKSNDEYKHDPLKWNFYYVPILQPDKLPNTNSAWATKKEIRTKLILGNDKVEDAARRAIALRYNSEISANYSRSWNIAPLMIDSMTAFIVKASGGPVEGVAPYRLEHPNALSITFHFECTHPDAASDVVEKLIDGDYEVEVHFYFAGFKRGLSNTMSITGELLKSVVSKIIADGGNSNAKYIHRDQANAFISNYITNVRKMIYIERPGDDISIFNRGLDEHFQALLQQGKLIFQCWFIPKVWLRIHHQDKLFSMCMLVVIRTFHLLLE